MQEDTSIYGAFEEEFSFQIEAEAITRRGSFQVARQVSNLLTYSTQAHHTSSLSYHTSSLCVHFHSYCKRNPFPASGNHPFSTNYPLSFAFETSPSCRSRINWPVGYFNIIIVVLLIHIIIHEGYYSSPFWHHLFLVTSFGMRSSLRQLKPACAAVDAALTVHMFNVFYFFFFFLLFLV